mgnify:CR=1 FL=1
MCVVSMYLSADMMGRWIPSGVGDNTGGVRPFRSAIAQGKFKSKLVLWPHKVPRTWH